MLCYSRMSILGHACPPETHCVHDLENPMQRLNPKDIERAFLHLDCPMFADLLDKLHDETELSPTRVRDMVSALRRVAKVLGLPPQDVPCDPRWLQPRLSKVRPAAHGISVKTWQNVVSDARGAMAHFGIVERRHRRRDELSPAWQNLWTAVLASNDPSLPPALSSVIYFFSRLGVAPDEVSDIHALAYKEGLENNEISRSPDRAYRAAVNGWNLAGKRLVDWPKNRLSLPSRQKRIQLPDGVLPLSFNNSLEEYLSTLGQVDPFADEGRIRALRPSSISLYRRLLLRFAADAVNGGTDPAQIGHLSALVTPVIFETGLRSMLKRYDNQTSQSISQTATLLCSLAKAKTFAMSAVDLRRISHLTQKVSLPRQQGLTPKNRKRLRILQDDQNLRRLINLPDTILARHRGLKPMYRYDLEREDAVAIAILLHCPIRAKNLSNIHLERSLIRPGDGRAFLTFEDHEVKNGRPLEFEIPKDVLRLIDQHLAKRSPTLCPRGTPWLFPRRNGKAAIGASELATRVARRVLKETGLEVNAHLFRHFAVMLLLDAHPGSYESASRLLGHSSSSHTISVYSGMETRAATKAFADLVASKKGPKQ